MHGPELCKAAEHLGISRQLEEDLVRFVSGWEEGNFPERAHGPVGLELFSPFCQGEMGPLLCKVREGGGEVVLWGTSASLSEFVCLLVDSGPLVAFGPFDGYMVGFVL